MNHVHLGPLINRDEVIVGQPSDGGALWASQSSSYVRVGMHAHHRLCSKLILSEEIQRKKRVLKDFRFVVARLRDRESVQEVCGRL